MNIHLLGYLLTALGYLIDNFLIDLNFTEIFLKHHF